MYFDVFCCHGNDVDKTVNKSHIGTFELLYKTH